jgi:penicillin-binding protein-related factor A (putative recombinase)
MAMRNEGKRFEDSFSASIPDYVLVKRLNDNAAGWSGGANTRFTSTNESDFICFDTNRRIFYGFELKSTQGTSFSFWREDFEIEDKKQTFQIKKNQILGLQKWSKFPFVVCGFIFNFRSEDNSTYFVSIQNFISYTREIEKKSINKADILSMDAIEIESRLLKTNYRYDIGKFLESVRI